MFCEQKWYFDIKKKKQHDFIHIFTLEPVIEEETITVEDAVKNLKGSLQAAYAAEDRLKDLLKREGLLA